MRRRKLATLGNRGSKAMHGQEMQIPAKSGLLPWNKGKLTGAKPPLRPKHIWSIRSRLQLEGRTRDLAMFNFAIDSKLRGCDVVALKVADIAPNGYSVDRATIRQKKTGQPVKFELTEETRQAVDDYLRATSKKPNHAAIHSDASRQGNMPALSPSGLP